MRIIIKNHEKKRYYISTAICILLMLVVTACVSTTPSPPVVGLFTAGGRVAGLTFISGHKHGVTDTNGVFYYNEGDTVEFFLGSARIGYAITGITDDKTYFSPFDIVNDTDTPDLQKNTVVNIARLLQSLDFDGNYENGITITREIIAHVTMDSIAFNVSGDDFTADPEIVDLFNRLNAAGIYASDRQLVSYDQAKTDLIVGMIKDEDTKPPAVLINLGDDWVCGTQSGFDNVHEYTQVYGYPALLADMVAVVFDIPWGNPLLDLDTGERVDDDLIPYNLGVPDATAQSVYSETTGGANTFLTKLLTPLNTDSNITQLGAVEKLMAENEAGFINIFTLSVGSNDVYRALLQTNDDGVTYTATLTTDSINTFLSSHTAAEVEDNITNIVNALKDDYSDSYVFITNLPDLDKIGVLFDASDINNLTPLADCTFSNLASDSYLGLPAFVSLGAGDTNLLGQSSNCTDIDTAIGGMGDADILTAAEAALIQTRIDEINTQIETLATDNDNVFLIDLNGAEGLFTQIADGEITVTVTDDDDNETELTLSTQYGGGVYSLDGLNLTVTGYTLVANLFNETIRTTLEDNVLGSNKIQDLVGDDVTLDVDPDDAYAVDPYRDMDFDFYAYGYNLSSRIDTYFVDLIDCDDGNSSYIGSFGGTCSAQ